ncbi:D-hexose-6-phosphate mutarotase [Terracidiphilus sp.]|uniref:D-hexose-6-phosphate mutarotase n=1 Tax=Terracidiphilus sp. TaxID=1964191 RepID=UPI003C1C9783
MTASELNQKFTLPGIAEIVEGNGTLPKIRITTPAATAEIYLHGAQVTSWIPAHSSEVIFLSSQSHWQEGKAIRGGIPICYPWFRSKSDDPQAPSHGVVRTTAWQIESIQQQDTNVVIDLVITSSDATRKFWPHDFHLTHRITVGSELKLELITRNTGTRSFKIEEALHTYFRVGDVEKVSVSGLDGVVYLDNVRNNTENTQHGDLAMSGPTDNAYIDTHSALTIIDPVLKRKPITEKTNSATTITWNPWQQGAASLSDLGDEEWREMICVEASNILRSAVEVAPAAEHIFAATLRVATL